MMDMAGEAGLQVQAAACLSFFVLMLVTLGLRLNASITWAVSRLSVQGRYTDCLI
jgi:hypothetical protein